MMNQYPNRQPVAQVVLLLLAAVWVAGLALWGVTPLRQAFAAPDYTAWTDLGIIYTAPSGDAYYPSVLYDASGFGGGSPLYKMWYSDGSGGVFVTTSANGMAWDAPTSAGGGLGGDAHHVQVLYNASGFGGGSPLYKIWYWDTNANLYSIDAIAYAESSDGITWSNDQALTQDSVMKLVTGAGSGWNRGTYGPVYLFYQHSAGNTGTEPWNYSYVMYYDGTSGQSEVTGLAYSTNGTYWTAYANNPVLDKGPSAWDSDDSVYGTVYHDTNGYHFWYSGGSCNTDLLCPVYEGIGYASSSDGQNWTKDASNPIFHISDGVSYRNKRVYTPAVVDDGSGVLKMYYSAQATGIPDQPKKIGLAVNIPTPPPETFVDDDWAGLPSHTVVFFPGDPRPHYIGVDAFATIQGGINAVAAGGTVHVAAGTYNEVVTINQSLTLSGNPGDPLVAGADPSNAPILDGTGLPGTPTAITVNSGVSNVTISGFAVQDYYAGISATNASNLNVNNNTLVSISYSLSGGCDNSNAVYVKGTGTNILGALSITYNTISNPNVYPGDAIYLRAEDTSSFNAPVITHNVISNRNGGIVTKVPSGGFFTDITVADNQYTLNASTGCWSSNAGIYLKNLQGNSRVERNTVNTVNSSAFSGIALFGTANNGSLIIQQNSLTGAGNPGLFFTSGYTPGGTAITVSENEVTGYNVGITLPNVSFSPSPAINRNSIHDNRWANQGISYSGPTILDASGNWWGSNSPTSVRNSFNNPNGVDYTPWLDSGTNTQPGAPGFHGDFSQLWVGAASPQTGTTGRIQEGVNLVTAGGTVTATAGTYTLAATVDITKPLTLLGPQANVDPRPDASTTRTPGDPTTEAIVDGGGTLSTLFHLAANDAVLNGLEVRNGTGDLIDSSAAPATQRLAVRYMIVHGSSSDEGVQLRDTTDSVLERNYVYDTTGDGLNIADSARSAIRDNEITGSRSIDGALYTYGSSDMTVERNYLHGNTSTSGIKVYKMGSGVIAVRDNRVEDNSFQLRKDNEVAAILLRPPYDTNPAGGSQIVIAGNQVVNNTCTSPGPAAGNGLYWQHEYVNGAPVLVSDNQFVGNTGHGIVMEVQSGVTAAYTMTGNTIRDNGHDGIYTFGAGNMSSQVAGNILCGNGDYEAENRMAVSLDARHNWWGHNPPVNAGTDYTGTVNVTAPISMSLAYTPVPGITDVPVQVRATFADDGYTVPNGLEVAWTASQGAISPPTSTTTSGVAATTLTAHTATAITSVVSAAVACGYVLTTPVRIENPTAVTLASFTATSYPGHVHVAWTTDSEFENYGFNVWRAEAATGAYTRLNAALIPAQGSPTGGASYAYDDAAVTNGVTYYYKLEDVDIYGTSTFHGPVEATVTRGFRLYLPLAAVDLS